MTSDVRHAALGWIKLVLWTAALWVFFAAAFAAADRIPECRQLAAHFEETGTNAGGIYYTEVEAVYDAQRMMRETVRIASHDR